MYNDKIKACFDAISPDKEQKARIFDAISKQTKPKRPPVILNKYISIAAAFALCAGGLYYAFGLMGLPPDSDSPKLVAKTGGVMKDSTELYQYNSAAVSDFADANRVNVPEPTDSSSDTLKKEDNAQISEFINTMPSQTESIAPDNENIPENKINSAVPDKDSSDYASGDKIYSKPSSGGGSSGGGSSASSIPSSASGEYDINKLISSTEYSAYIPLSAPDSFRLDSASVYGDTLTLTYLSDSDRIVIKIAPDKHDRTAISLEEIKSLNSNSVRLIFSLAMDSYRADVNAPASMVQEIYTMFVSAKYFN